MANRFVVNEKSELQEKRLLERRPAPPALKIVALVLSYLFHPLFLPVYVAFLVVHIIPYLFVGFDNWTKNLVIIQTVVMYTFFPLVTVLLLKAVKFIESIHMPTQRDRIIPYVVCMVYYFWAWYVSKNLVYYPEVFVAFRLAVFIASIFGLMANIYFKISMHTLAAGVVAAFVCLLAWNQGVDLGLYIAAALLMTGLVATSRLLITDHTPKEIYLGFFFGVVSMVLGSLFT